VADPQRTTAISGVQHEITALVRRTRARSAHLNVELSLVDYSLLEHMRTTGGCRAADLAVNFHLARSTVSRQVDGLERAGLVERVENSANRASPLLRPSRAGSEALARADRARAELLDERLAEWDTDDIALLASLLARYNRD
jgi:DNA-binding MarR family transcriptional regulator